jgi:hypothetical protein
MAFVTEWNDAFEAIPASDKDYHLVGQQIRDLKVAYKERIARGHRFQAVGEGSHDLIYLEQQTTPPTVASGECALYTTSGVLDPTRDELYVRSYTPSGEVSKPITRYGSYCPDVIAQVKTSAAYTATGVVPYDTEELDTLNTWDPATYTFTAPKDGLYAFLPSWGLNGPANYLYMNEDVKGPSMGTIMVFLAIGDQVQHYATATSGTPVPAGSKLDIILWREL